MEKIKQFFAGILAAIVGFFGTLTADITDLVNDYEFTVDSSQYGDVLSNPASNINIWSIEGDPFVGAVKHPEYDIMEFVNYIQLMQCSGGNAQRDLFVDPYDKTVLDDYNFAPLINNCRGILELGAKPLLKLGSVPLKYSAKANTDAEFDTNIYPPDDYNVYYNYIAALAQALVDEFGKEEVLTWRFGVMTEYENASWFMANSGDPDESAAEYCKLYDYTVAALIDVIGDVFVGAHSMTVTEGIWDEAEFIKHCAQGTNYKTGKKGSRLCYLSASFYDHEPGNYTDGKTLAETIDYLRETAESYGLNNLIFGIDEGRILCGNTSGKDSDQLLSRTCGYTYQAGYDARMYKTMFENDINYFSSWDYLSNGLFDGNPTVSYHVASNAAKFGGAKLVSTEKTKRGYVPFAEVDAVSAFDEGDNTLRIMAYNFKNKVNYTAPANINFTVKVPQFEGQNVKITAYVIDDDCNYFDEWQEDRVKYGIGDDCFGWSPDDPTIESTVTLSDPEAREIYYSELHDKYYECSKLVPTETTATVVNGEISLDITLDPHAVVFYEITPC
ncbi:MAG: hypothetical protein U0L11_04130 [Acutalibacteraceae bacterium]|nr:hypothetical protein [Acutalibacteraceae bacterium]